MSIPSVLILACIPLLVALLDRAERQFGSARAGWISSFPIVGAPALLIVTLLHGAAFGAVAAESATLGILGWAAFICTYRFGVGGRRFGGPGLVATSALAWLTVSLLLIASHPPEATVLVILPATILLAISFGSVRVGAKGKLRSALWPRAAMATAMVVLVVAVSNTLGGRAAGLFASFPIVSGSLVVPVALCGERDRVTTMTKGMLTAGPALATFMTVLSQLLGPGLGTAVPFLVATTVALAVHAAMWQVAVRRGTGGGEDRASGLQGSIAPPILAVPLEDPGRQPQ